MASEEQHYSLQVTAGPDYNPATHQEVAVNGDGALTIETEHATVNLCVRIQDYTGLPDSSPETSSYFSHPNHIYDQYSIAISLVPKQDIRGTDLVFGNDFDHPIRDRLPPGTSYALKLVKWMIDPGIEADAYADWPYLYGAALSSWNYLKICGREGERHHRPSPSAEEHSASTSEGCGSSVVKGKDESGASSIKDSGAEDYYTAPDPAISLPSEVIEEGSEGSGEEVRSNLAIPETADMRRRFFLDEQNKDAFAFEAGRIYKSDFGNPYIGFNDFTLRLPGFHLQIAKYIDAKNHALRYVLKNKSTGDIYFVLVFTLLFQSQREQEQAVSQGQTEESEVD